MVDTWVGGASYSTLKGRLAGEGRHRLDTYEDYFKTEESNGIHKWTIEVPRDHPEQAGGRVWVWQTTLTSLLPLPVGRTSRRSKGAKALRGAAWMPYDTGDDSHEEV